MASLPTLPLEIQNKIMIEHKGFNPYPFNEEFKWYIDCCCLDPDPFVWPECINKPKEFIYSQFEDEDSYYHDEWGNISSNILHNMHYKLYEDRQE
jgi:hypothetical protein